MKKQLGFTAVELVTTLFMAVVVIGGGIGWAWNIIKIIAAVSDPVTGMFILRCVGAFAFPIGAIVGYF